MNILFNSVNILNNKPMVGGAKALSFKALPIYNVERDSFETKKKKYNVAIYNPYALNYCYGTVRLDLSKPQKFSLSVPKGPFSDESELEFDYHPKRKGIIWDKQNNRPIETAILESHRGKKEKSFHFMSKDLQTEYGYVNLENCSNPEIEKQILFTPEYHYKDYIKQGIVGPRVVVGYLYNNDDHKFGGIGKLADKLAVGYCMLLGIEPNIVSEAESSHVAHFLRGKRFLSVESSEYEAMNYFLKNKYGSNDVNKIIEKLIEESKQTGKPVDLNGWRSIPMYLPKGIALKYKNEIKSEKLFI